VNPWSVEKERQTQMWRDGPNVRDKYPKTKEKRSLFKILGQTLFRGHKCKEVLFHKPHRNRFFNEQLR
jgi:hypothetical protein